MNLAVGEGFSGCMSPVSCLQATRRQGVDGISDANHAEDSAIGPWVPSLLSLRWLCVERGARQYGGGRGTGGSVEGGGTGSTGSSLHPTPTMRLSGDPEVPGKTSRERAGLEQCGVLSLEQPRAAEAEWGKGNVITET